MDGSQFAVQAAQFFHPLLTLSLGGGAGHASGSWLAAVVDKCGRAGVELLWAQLLSRDAFFDPHQLRDHLGGDAFHLYAVTDLEAPASSPRAMPSLLLLRRPLRPELLTAPLTVPIHLRYQPAVTVVPLPPPPPPSSSQWWPGAMLPHHTTEIHIPAPLLSATCTGTTPPLWDALAVEALHAARQHGHLAPLAAQVPGIPYASRIDEHLEWHLPQQTATVASGGQPLLPHNGTISMHVPTGAATVAGGQLVQWGTVGVALVCCALLLAEIVRSSPAVQLDTARGNGRATTTTRRVYRMLYSAWSYVVD